MPSNARYEDQITKLFLILQTRTGGTLDVDGTFAELLEKFYTKSAQFVSYLIGWAEENGLSKT